MQNTVLAVSSGSFTYQQAVVAVADVAVVEAVVEAPVAAPVEAAVVAAVAAAVVQRLVVRTSIAVPGSTCWSCRTATLGWFRHQPS